MSTAIGFQSRPRARVRRRATPRVMAWLLLLTGAVAPARAEPEAGHPEHVYGVQLHLHGSLSEGSASMAGHNYRARELGGAVDVIWWTDHDWRIAAHTHVVDFGFEDGLLEERAVPRPLTLGDYVSGDPDRLPDWASRSADGSFAEDALETMEVGFRRVDPQSASSARIEVHDRRAREGERSLRLALVGDGRARQAALAFGASRRRHVIALASLPRVSLSIFPQQLEGTAAFSVSFVLSTHDPEFRGRIDYRLAPGGIGAIERVERVRRRAGRADKLATRVAHIEMPVRLGEWNDLVFDLAADAETHGLGGIDNAAVHLVIGVETRGAGGVDVDVDALRIERRRVGQALFVAEKKMARALSKTGLRNHVGQEISYGAHLNAYGPKVPLADSDAHPHGLTPTQAVDLAHAHGGIVSLNHVFGIEHRAVGHNFPSSRPNFDASVAGLVAVEAYGADLLEVGYRARGYGLNAFLELWDALSSAGVYITGIGVSDSHDTAVGWGRGPNNFITWVYAASDEEEALMAALQRGRAFFGDPTRFDGRLDLRAVGGVRMGDVVSTGGAPIEVTVSASGLRAGQRVRVVRDGRVVSRHDVSGERFEGLHRMPAAHTGFVRFEIIEAGEVIAASNPVYVVADPDGRIPAVRRPGERSPSAPWTRLRLGRPAGGDR